MVYKKSVMKLFVEIVSHNLWLQGLTIGGLPTFVDIGNSFGTPALAEDNLINQVLSIYLCFHWFVFA